MNDDKWSKNRKFLFHTSALERGKTVCLRKIEQLYTCRSESSATCIQ